MKKYMEPVFVTTPGRRKATATSGILVNEKYVMTTAAVLVTILEEFLELKRDAYWNFTAGLKSVDEVVSQIRFKVYRETRKGVTCMNGELIAYWKCPLVAASLENLSRDWTVSHGGDVGSDDVKSLPKHHAVFLVLRCKEMEVETMVEGKETLRDVLSSLIVLGETVAEPMRGEEINVVSTPFGNGLLMNSLSKGIVSNVVGKNKCLLLTDARTVPGCEGGPIFTCDKSRFQLVGLVTCPLSWWRGEWVGLTIGISLKPVLMNLFRVEGLRSEPFRFNSGEALSGILKTADEGVVLVQRGTAWGSGVALDPSTVITCSHVLKGNGKVSIFTMKFRFDASIVYRTPDDVPYDLAILRLEEGTLNGNGLKFCDEPPQIGDEVFAVGFPFFTYKDEADLRASIVRGSIARTNDHMIQSTCCVQSGFSGGPLLKNGKLLGVIICNIKDSGSGALYPHVNFAVPTTVFSGPVEAYLRTKNAEFLTSLESSDPQVKRLWSLETLQNSKL